MNTVLITLMTSILIFGCTIQPKFERQKLLVDKYVEIWNTGNFDGIEEILHPDFELRMTPKYEAEVGIKAFKDGIAKWRTAYPDFHIKIDEEIYSDNKGAVRWTITATNTGEGDMPPTGKRVEVMGISVFHIQDNKIKDEWIASNNLYWLKQLGFTIVLPSDE